MKYNGNGQDPVTNISDDLTQMERRIGLLRQVAGKAALDSEINHVMVTQNGKDIEALEARVKDMEAYAVRSQRRLFLILAFLGVNILLDFASAVLMTLKVTGVL